MGSDIPALSDAKWKRIAKLLPESKRDPVMIGALLFRQTTGSGLRDIAEWAGVSRTRLSEWDRALSADGTLPRIMAALKLERAGTLCWSGGGQRWQSRDQDVEARVTALRFRHFREALRGR